MKTSLSLFILFLLLFSAGCQHEKEGHDHFFTTQNMPADTLFQLPTYDGSGQGVHPDILFLNPPLRGNHFLLAFTPYPFGNDQFENPSVLMSENGINFKEEIPHSNPLMPKPPYDHNNDPDIFYDPVTQKFELYYLQAMRPDSQNLIRLESSDAIHWKSFLAIHYDLKANQPFIVSPSIIKNMDELGYSMYYVKLGQNGAFDKIEFLESIDGKTWDTAHVHSVQTNFPSFLYPWHVDVLSNGREYFMLCFGKSTAGGNANAYLYLGRSTDKINWQFSNKPLLSPDSNWHQCFSPYRSSGLIQGDELGIWYSISQLNGEWKIGFKKDRISHYF